MKPSVQNKRKVFGNSYSKKNKYVEVVKKNKRISFVSNIMHSAKRHLKQLLKRLLLSRVFHTAFKITVGILIFFSSVYGFYSYFNKSFANGVVVSKSEIIDRISKLTIIPNEPPEDVKRVEDSELLKKQNIFFENVKIGDYIIIYPKLAIIYDLRNNKIIAIKKSE